jgi:hypothetical protein
MHIVVTTPKSELENSKQEAKSGAKYWFRKLPSKPKNTGAGDRIYYVANNEIVGFAYISTITDANNMHCSTTGRDWGKGVYAIIDAKSWTPIKPIPYKGFRGFRYYDNEGVNDG